MAKLPVHIGKNVQNLWKGSEREEMSRLEFSPAPEFFTHVYPKCQMNIQGKTEFAEVQYYFKAALHNNNVEQGFAMVSVYAPPDTELLKLSNQTLWSCEYTSDKSRCVVTLQSIQSVMAIVPHPHMADKTLQCKLSGRVYVGGKMGLDMMYFASHVDNPVQE